MIIIIISLLCRFMSKYSKDDPNQKRLLMVDQALGQVFRSQCRVPESFLEPGRKLLATQPPTRSTLKAMLLQILHDPSVLVSGVLMDGTYIGVCWWWGEGWGPGVWVGVGGWREGAVQ